MESVLVLKCSRRSLRSLSGSLFLFVQAASPKMPASLSMFAASIALNAATMALPTFSEASRTSAQCEPSGMPKLWFSGSEANSESPPESSSACSVSSSYTSEMRLKKSRGKMYCL